MTPQEFDAFYTASFSRVAGQIYAITGDWGEAQDAVQDAFIRAWDHRRTFDLEHAPEAWIRITAWRLAVSRWRRVTRGLRLAERYHERRTVEPPGDAHLLLTAALRELPEVERRALVLHYLCDLSVEQVAVETGSTTSAVKSRLARGRAGLAAGLVDDTAVHEGAKPRD
jgi:RNA polymerase sigma-70 factor (ECF subfamily)